MRRFANAFNVWPRPWLPFGRFGAILALPNLEHSAQLGRAARAGSSWCVPSSKDVFAVEERYGPLHHTSAARSRRLNFVSTVSQDHRVAPGHGSSSCIGWECEAIMLHVTSSPWDFTFRIPCVVVVGSQTGEACSELRGHLTLMWPGRSPSEASILWRRVVRYASRASPLLCLLMQCSAVTPPARLFPPFKYLCTVPVVADGCATRDSLPFSVRLV